ncbi:uncharacterized protein METZ01_LOCUS178414 [marine metagenome]|uniref:Uncharacterized protein n=1 Tax=marine metagenome TaxID=408172 RepID=A0A382CHN0_9ZZZZ|tara:strand:+ start:5352 stop:5747 length:396 start_codon:yes stop_codon:yes gene_type:complete
MSNSAKDFCLVRNNLVKEIPQKAWIRYISKKNMIVNKGGMLLKNNASNDKEKFLLLKSPSGPMWRVYTNENYIYVDKHIVDIMKVGSKKVKKKLTNNSKSKEPVVKKNIKKIKREKKRKYTKKTKVIKIDI